MIGELERIKSLLWKSWDPIGVNGSDGAQDEYDSYAFAIFTMLHAGADQNSIADYLHRAVTENIGLSGNREAEVAIAGEIMSIHEEARR